MDEIGRGNRYSEGMNPAVELGALEGDIAKPVFRASVGDIEFYVELDSSALQKLAFSKGDGDWRGSIEAQRGKIRTAAQALYDEGFLTRDVVPRLFLTALDII